MSDLDAIRVDARGLACPLPIFQLARAAKGAPPGAVLHLVGSDPAILPDVRAWCDAMGFELVRAEQSGELYEGWVRKPL